MTDTATPTRKPSNAQRWVVLTVAVLSLAALLQSGCVGPSFKRQERYPGGGGPIYHEDGRRIEVTD